MAGAKPATRTAKQPDKGITRSFTACIRTGMPAPACAIHFPGGNALKADARPFLAPYRTIAIIHRHRSTGENSACGGKQQRHQ
jgi:hypothetical protein